MGSMKKRKNKNSLKNNPGAENGCKLSEENKRKSKSIEMFDYYVNSIDEIKSHETEQYTENEKIKIDAQERKEIESLLITTPTDMTHENKDEPRQEYSEEPDSKVFEETERATCKSNQGSKCNTLRRGKNSRNSKKRRKSKHIL